MRVLNFGSLNIDYVYRVDSFLKPGETKAARSLAVFAGGKGLNQALALARAGVDVAMAGKIGQEGQFLVEKLQEGGVDTAKVEISRGATGHAVIQVDDRGSNCILLFGGANKDMDEDFIIRALAGFGKGDLLLLQNEISSIAKIIRAAKIRGMTVALNPSPFDAGVVAYPLDLVDLFMLNEIEAADLAGETDPEKAAAVLAARYPKAKVVVTLGAEGALCHENGQIVRQTAYKVKALDTTAAGDTFTGYFLAGLIEGMDNASALDLGAKAAALCVTRPGAAESIPLRSELS